MTLTCGVPQGWPVPQLEPCQIRLLVYQDCERRGRNVLFDSNAKKRGADEANSNNAEGHGKMFGKCCQLRSTGGSSSSLDSSSSSTETRDTKEQGGLRFQGSRCSSDVVMLGEMMFGSVAMSYKGSTLKIHQIRSPPQLMLSKVFTARTGGSAYGSLNTLQDSLEFIGQDNNTLRPDPHAGPSSLLSNIGFSQLCSPRRAFSEQGRCASSKAPLSFQCLTRVPLFPSLASLSSLWITPFHSPSSSLNSSCASSYQRRWLRSQTTSLENGVFPRWSVEESFNMSDDSAGPSLGVARKKKIAIGENNRFQDFFFSHFPLFESHMNKLKTAIEQAMKMSRRSADANQRAQAYSRMVEGLNEFRNTVCDLYTMPRVAEPVWLTMMSGASEKNQLCGTFMRELSLLMEQASKNQFLPALLTAVLTNHLAWVPTVMPNGQPPIRSSWRSTRLKCGHAGQDAPVQPALGPTRRPVRRDRLSRASPRTVVVGRRQELVQRLLYVLTYFIRCSELLEQRGRRGGGRGHSDARLSHHHQPEEGGGGGVGLFLVTVHKPSETYLSQSQIYTSDHSLQSSTCTEPESAAGDTLEETSKEEEEDEEDVDSSESQGSRSSVLQSALNQPSESTTPLHKQSNSPVFVEPKLETVLRVGSASPMDYKVDVCSLTSDAKDLSDEVQPAKTQASLEKKPPDKTQASAVPVPTNAGPMALTDAPKVTFLIGVSMSPESDTESKSRQMAEEIKKQKQLLLHQPQDQTKVTNDAPSLRESASKISKLTRNLVDDFDEYFSLENPIETRTIDDLAKRCADTDSLSKEERSQTLGPCLDSGQCKSETGARCRCGSGDSSDFCCRSSTVGRAHGLTIGVPVLPEDGGKKEDQKRKALPLNDWDIPRNESSDSALGDSETEETEEWQEEVLPFPGSKLSEAYSRPSIANFGRSLFGGYCPTYVPDFVLHGMPSDDKLRQSLTGELSHAVQCIMHLEDRLQEIYFKSKMLAEYLKGQTRVHVKELGMVLGIESSDLPLLAAVASTHSPYVAQILL
ncbi:hypothetical protein WMY93_007950 [Mugilogobius chulae]|uniref:UDENN FNIP1/2-type domain-containing protein n=1 Tax=Mugilogobius chulae TaxID=88201 RepID=A0AAW0PQC3_9GOBI